jgi:hypothetical protein
MLKTLAAKHDSTVTKTAARHRATIETPDGVRTCFTASIDRDGKQPLVARFGGIPLKRQRHVRVTDRVPGHTPGGPATAHSRREIVSRLLRKRCEICDRRGEVEAHHVAQMADLGTSEPRQPAWAQLMAAKQRKSLVVCVECHHHIHATPVTSLTT